MALVALHSLTPINPSPLLFSSLTLQHLTPHRETSEWHVTYHTVGRRVTPRYKS